MTLLIALLCNQGLLLASDRLSINATTKAQESSQKVRPICKNKAVVGATGEVGAYDSQGNLRISVSSHIESQFQTVDIDNNTIGAIQTSLDACWKNIRLVSGKLPKFAAGFWTFSDKLQAFQETLYVLNPNPKANIGNPLCDILPCEFSTPTVMGNDEMVALACGSKAKYWTALSKSQQSSLSNFQAEWALQGTSDQQDAICKIKSIFSIANQLFATCSEPIGDHIDIFLMTKDGQVTQVLSDAKV